MSDNGNGQMHGKAAAGGRLAGAAAVPQDPPAASPAARPRREAPASLSEDDGLGSGQTRSARGILTALWRRRAIKIAVGAVLGWMVLDTLLSRSSGDEDGGRRSGDAGAGEQQIDELTASQLRSMAATYKQESDGVRRDIRTLGAYLEAAGQELQASRKEVTGMRTQLEGSEARTRDFINQFEERQRGLMEKYARGPLPIRIRDARDLSIVASADPAAGRKLYVPAGSFAKARLLTGIYAPVSGNELPVVLRITEIMTGPNGSSVPVDGALVVGRALGDANASRAHVQLQTISYVSAEGRAIESQINGFVVDDDGIEGVQGQYVWRIGDILGPAMLASAAKGMSDALAARQRTVLTTPFGGTQEVVTGDEFKYAGFNALGGAMSTLQQTIVKRTDDFVPAIWVANTSEGGGGRDVTVLFLSGFPMDVELSEVTGGADSSASWQVLDARQYNRSAALGTGRDARP